MHTPRGVDVFNFARVVKYKLRMGSGIDLQGGGGVAECKQVGIRTGLSVTVRDNLSVNTIIELTGFRKFDALKTNNVIQSHSSSL